MRNFSIIVGRWYGVWCWIWYADIMHESDDVPYMSFNAFSRRGALRKSKRYIRRLTSPIENKNARVYYFDESTLTMEQIDV